MADEDDDEALSWGGGRDSTHVESPVERATPKPSRAERRAARADGAAASTTESTDAASTSTVEAGLSSASSAILVILGILAGVYLLYTIGWVITANKTVTTDAPSLELVALAVKKVLAIVSCAFWFAATLWLTRGRRPIVRVGWLVIGAIVLVPWPFVFGI